MGGAPKQVNGGQATTAANGAFGAGGQLSGFAGQDQGNAQQIHDTFFGDGKGGKGSLTDMMDPNAANNPNLNSFYKLGYDQSVQQGENEAANSKRGIFSTLNNNGLGVNNGLALDYNRKANLDQANSKGAAYASAVGSQHNEALNNFWGATNVAANEANASRSTAVGAGSGAGQTYSNIYGTAGKQSAPGIGTTLLGGSLQAGGAVGAAAMCVAEDGKILTTEGWLPVQSLKKGSRLVQLGGISAPLAVDPIKSIDTPIALVRTINGMGGMVSHSHSYVRADSGYSNAREVFGKVLKTMDGDAVVNNLFDAGTGTVYRLITEGDTNHTYCADGIWCLE